MQVGVTNFTIEAQAEETQETFWEQVNAYALMIFDGLGFFGFSWHKIDRNKGIPVTWRTQIPDCLTGTFMLIVFVVSVVIIIQELSKLGTQKQDVTLLRPGLEFKYNAREHLTVLTGSWF